MNEVLENKLVEKLIGDKSSNINQLLNQRIEDITNRVDRKINETEELLTEKISRISDKLKGQPIKVNLGSVKKPENKVLHEKFDTIIKILESTNRIEKHIMLVGPCGSGKSSLCSDIAKALKIDFYPMSVGLQTTKSDLLGFINAKGEYVTTPIRQAFENGGLLLLDEFDATNPSTVTILNSMLANNICSFPDKIVSKHKNFICIVACNTYGKGADISYVGRNRLDASTLDRFIVVNVDYDENLEKHLTPNNEWFKCIKKMRSNINKFGVKTIISPRASMQGADLLEHGFSFEDVVNMVVLKGASEDVRNKILNGVTYGKKKKEVKKSDSVKITFSADRTHAFVEYDQDFSMITELDWEGKYSIFISKDKEYISSLDSNSNKIFLNCGDNKFDKQVNLTKLVNDIEENISTYNVSEVSISIVLSSEQPELNRTYILECDN